MAEVVPRCLAFFASTIRLAPGILTPQTPTGGKGRGLFARSRQWTARTNRPRPLTGPVGSESAE